MNKVTYEQISEKTGISVATISRCFKGNVNVKEDTRYKIISAAEDLGMDTSVLLDERQRSKLIIFNIPSLENPFYSTIIRGARVEAERRGYDLLINEGHIRSNTINSFLSLLKRTKAAGLITTNHIEPAILKRLNSSIPLVQCCECLEDEDVPYVTIDDKKASEQATEYLISLGRRKIAFLNGPMQYKYAKNRKQGFINGLEKAGIKPDENMIISLENVSFDSALAVAMQLINSKERPDAFVTISDVYAAAAIKAVIKNGFRVPEDVSVVGFDNIESAALFNPAITTVSQPRLRIGTLSADILIKEIEHENYLNKKIILDTELIIRESTAMCK